MLKQIIAASLFIAFAANAAAQAPSITPNDRMAILHAINAHPSAGGQVVNECSERVTPQFFPANIGGPVGTAVLAVIPGGPNSATCYGDGPGALFLMKREGTNFRVIFQGQGYLAILPSAHSGAHDISIGGPGFSFPVYTWNGQQYAISSRTISDTQFGAGQMLPP